MRKTTTKTTTKKRSGPDPDYTSFADAPLRPAPDV
jgi:hypothetical protein